MLVDFRGTKKVEGRILCCIAKATRPMSLEDLFVDLVERYKKNYRTGLDNATFRDALEANGRNGWIDPRELRILPLGKEVYDLMYLHKDGQAEKFFIPSNSPNVPVPEQAGLPGFPRLKANTW
jgi:hypothetical protein